MASESLNDFELVSFVPHVAIYTLYVAVKYLVVLWEMVVGFLSSRRSLQVYPTSGFVHISFFLSSLFASCFCCCCCCGRKKSAVSNLFKNTRVLSAKFIKSVVNVLFSSKDTLVDSYLEEPDSDAKQKRVKKADKETPRVYIRGVPLGHKELSYLMLLIYSFFLLVGITAWDVFFLEVTYVCSEDSSVSCFPLAIDHSVIDDVGVNLVEAQEHRITNCSLWDSESLSGRISFLCFRWNLNSKAVISTVGGLLTVFVLSVKILAAALMSASEAVINKAKSLRGRHLVSRHLSFLRIAILLLVGTVEVSFAVMVLVGYLFVRQNHWNSLFVFYNNLGNQIILCFGILSTVLHLPIEKFAAGGSEYVESESSSGSEGGSAP